MNIQMVPISKINPAEYNSRVDLQPDDPRYQRIKKSMTNFGYIDPIIWNSRTGNLVGGHQRLKILKAQGLLEVEVSVVDLPLEKEKQLNIGLNKIQGDWDEEKLANLFKDLEAVPDIDITLTGFDLPEIDEIMDRHLRLEEDDYNFEEAIERISEPITQSGDIIELGSHRIMCADSSILEDLERLFEDAQASLYWSDWPYNTNYNAGNRPGAVKSKWDSIKNDNLSDEKYSEWMRQVLAATKPFLKDGCPVYIWNGHRQFWTMSQRLVENGFHPACVLTWAKPGFSPSYADYQQQTEFCLYGWKLGAPHSWYGSAESSLWEINRDPVNSLIHPTQKPIALAQRAIRNSSRRGEIVFDSCLGSGSALIAAESLGRRCFGCELARNYCDALILRYIDYVGADKVSSLIKSKYLM